MEGFLHGARCLIEGFRWLPRRGIRGPAAIPLLINLVLYLLMGWYVVQRFSALLDRFLPAGLEWLQWLLWPLFVLLVLVVAVLTFTIVANLVAAPFNQVLAERVASHLSLAADASAFSLMDIPGALLFELRKAAYFVLWAIVLVILTLIPGIGLLAPLLWMLFGCWSLALEYGDYAMGQRRLPFRAQRRLLREHPRETLGFGAAALAATLIPGLNLAVIPAAVVGACLLWLPQLQENPQKNGF